MMTMLHDQKERQAATDPRHSYIVEAPAGSGKTEILTQRFLRLLSQVQEPEQIIALTFTRKAANEMRERVLSALRHVAAGDQPTNPHQQSTYQYAQQALAHDHVRGWHVLQHGSRLRIMTIDALCQLLAQAIPVHATHYATIADQPEVLYYQAARAYVQEAQVQPAYQADLKILLQHVDNRQDVLVALFAEVLAQRDQWLTPIFLARTQSKQDYEQALAWMTQHELSRFCQTIPTELQQALWTLIHTLRTEGGSNHAALDILASWQEFTAITPEEALALASLLLTSNQSLRKGFDHHIGFKRDNCPEPYYTQIKTQSKQLCEALQNLPEFTAALIHISHIPRPEFAEQQWGVLQALFRVLPVLVAHLTLQFQEQHRIDFTGIAHQAKLALGHIDSPSDLALYLDHQIQHLLIDEFQDTSIQQFELLTHLIQGWEPYDGRTLFIVGDPMQSIYRFRAAEVGLFLRAKTQGIGPVHLIPLQLSANFRSAVPIVTWVNQQFAHIFPQQDDIEMGAVSFHAATPMVAGHEGSFVRAFQCGSPSAEAEKVINILEAEWQEHPHSSIAILVRSRSQLRSIITALRQKQIPFQGVDIDLLAQLPHLRDIESLTQAFLMPAHRLAWLAWLRSPWVGLDLADLLILAQTDTSIYQALGKAHTLSGLSAEGLIRAQYVYQVFQAAYTRRQQLPLVDMLQHMLKQMHQAVLLSPAEQEDLEQYWTLLQQFTVNEQILDYALFKKQFNRLYSQKTTPANLHIMTIHKSKGLEFDCVILPGLGAQPQQSDPALMRWLKLPRQTAEDIFLISPIKAMADEACRVYDYLAHLDAEKTYYESQRVLYVAATRAKHRLYLLDHHPSLRKKSFRHMLLTQAFTETPSNEPTHTLVTDTVLPMMQRLPLAYYQAPPRFTLHPAHNDPANYLFPSSIPRLIGIATHALLQWICTYHPATYADIPWSLAQQYLNRMGFVDVEYDTALRQIQALTQTFFEDPRGQWIAAYRPDESNEFAILVENSAATRVIDRSFTENGIRWIIDFKTGQPDPQTLAQHRNQLTQYAALFQTEHSIPIRCGLYYLYNQEWVEWMAQPAELIEKADTPTNEWWDHPLEILD